MRPYPETRRCDVRETLHGVEVADPYRWLEDADGPEVAAWVERQRSFTDRALDALPDRGWFADVMDGVMSRPRAGIPIVRGGRYFVNRNDGASAQDVWFMADTLDELVRGGTVVLDPNAWSPDGTASLSTFAVSCDGRRLVYGVSEGGSDWQRFRVKDLSTLTDLDRPDVVGKFSVPRWLPDNASFLYSTFDEASDARGTATAGLGAARLMVHRLDADSEDELVLTFPDEPRLMAFAEVSHDGRWLVVSIVLGTESVNRVWAYPLVTAHGRTTIGEPVKVVDEPVAGFGFVRTDGDALYLTTDLDAPHGRLVRVDLGWAARGDVEFAEVVPETTATLAGVEPFGDDFLVAYLHDAQTLVVHTRADGVVLDELDLPGGALVGLDGAPDRASAFVGISTLDAPTTAFRVDAPDPGSEKRADVERLELATTAPGLAPPFTVERRRATSADGTEVPYFLVVGESTNGAGPRPTLLYGYGGFKIPVLADYRPGWSAWLRAGGVLAIANLRGGGEFGTRWYEDGRLAKKQNVFDDAIAVAEHLVETGVTSPDRLAIHGRSNGGLLVGAAMTQRPDLFAAALPAVGVLDLLRFHRFTIGGAWVSDYGDPDEPEGFAAVLAYSPLHNVRDDVSYPATLICTADHDDRVVPLHSFKFGAALQAAQGGRAPVLLRIESSAGHGAGKSRQMVAAEWADLLAFAAHHTGLRPEEAGAEDAAVVAG